MSEFCQYIFLRGKIKEVDVPNYMSMIVLFAHNIKVSRKNVFMERINIIVLNVAGV